MYNYSKSARASVSRFPQSVDYEATLSPTKHRRRTSKIPDHDEVHLLESIDTTYRQSNPHAPKLPKNLKIDDSRLAIGRSAGYARLDGTEDTVSTFRGWRKAVIAAAAITGFVLAINTAATIFALIKFKVNDGVGFMYWGDCNLVKRWDTALHLAINVLGTALLAASSFTMQCLSSPTRSEVTKAHAKRKSLDIGIASLRNLFYVKGWKGILWVLLCLSSMPLHLLWNSTIFSSAGVNLFTYVVATEDFLNGGSYDDPTSPKNTCVYSSPENVANHDTISTLFSGYRSGSYTKLTSLQCLDDYKSNTLTTRRNLIMVLQGINSTTAMGCSYGGRSWNGSSVVAAAANARPAEYLRDLVGGFLDDIDVEAMRLKLQSSGVWAVGNFTVDHCFSEAVDSKCQLGFVSWILYIVIGCNAVKFVCMCFAARYLWDLDEPIMATVGDAVSSFLQQPDGTTRGLCLIDLNDIRGGVLQKDQYRKRFNPVYGRKPRTRLYSATTPARWWWSMIPCVCYLLVGFVLLGLSFGAGGITLSQAMKLNFGEVDANLTLGIEGDSGGRLILDVVIANSFQLALSTTYFLYNSLYTAQCGALEWASYIRGKRKALRVTWPVDQQRSTYYLQLPYQYGIPLIVMLVLMHFLISQSIFLARMTYSDWQGNLIEADGFSNVGFSPRAILTACLVGFVLILAQVVHAFRRLENRIPIHGNQSAVISAMCHPPYSSDSTDMSGTSNPPENECIATKPITWGVTRKPGAYAMGGSQTGSGGPGHCSFSADMVELPEQGQEYR